MVASQGCHQGHAGSVFVQRRVRRPRNRNSRSNLGKLEAFILGSSVPCSFMSVGQGEQKKIEQGTSSVPDGLLSLTRVGTIVKGVGKPKYILVVGGSEGLRQKEPMFLGQSSSEGIFVELRTYA